jgi:hypothetical protein
MLVLRVGRCERRTSLTVNLGCWHALPMGIHATLMLAPGCSPRRPKSEPRRLPRVVTDGGGGADVRRASNRLIETEVDVAVLP